VRPVNMTQTFTGNAPKHSKTARFYRGTQRGHNLTQGKGLHACNISQACHFEAVNTETSEWKTLVEMHSAERIMAK